MHAARGHLGRPLALVGGEAAEALVEDPLVEALGPGALAAKLLVGDRGAGCRAADAGRAGD